MAFLARKIAGCRLSQGSEVYTSALLELYNAEDDFFKFVLHLKTVRSSSSKRVGVCRIIYLEENKAEEVLTRYITRKGETGKYFPEVKSKQWKRTTCWLSQLASGPRTSSFRRVTKTHAASRLKSGRRFRASTLWKRIRQIERQLQ